MFRKAIDSMSFRVFLDLVVTERVISLTSYSEVSEQEFETNAGIDTTLPGRVRSLSFDDDFIPGQLPPTVSGVYHNRLPCVRMNRPWVRGETLHANLQGRYFRGISYSVLDLDDPSIRSGEKCDAAVWVCGVDYEGHTRPFYNAIAFETSTKMHPMRSVRNLGTPSNLFIYQPFADTPLTQCSITLKYNTSLGYRSNVEGFVEDTDYNYLCDLDDAFPSIDLNSGGGLIPIDGFADVQVSLTSEEGKDAELYLEATAGYLPKRRVRTTSGVARFRVGALGLQAGDCFKVKVGLRNFSGMLDVPFEVAA